MKKLILIVLMFSSVLGVKAQDTTKWRLNEYCYIANWGFDFDSLGGVFTPHLSVLDYFDSTGVFIQRYSIRTKQVFQSKSGYLYGINGEIDLPSHRLYHYEGDSLYKMDTNGVLQWKVPFSAGFIAPGAGTDFYAIARDTSFKDYAYSAGVKTNVIISKLDSSANVVWQDTIKSIGANSWVEVYGVRSNERGDLVMHGYFKDSIQVGGMGYSSIGPSSVQFFLALMDSLGNFYWVRTDLQRDYATAYYTHVPINYIINEEGKVYYMDKNGLKLYALGIDSSISILKNYVSVGDYSPINFDISGNIVVAGFGFPVDTASFAYPNGSYLTSIDTLGNILWKGAYGEGVGEWGLGAPLEIKVDKFNNIVINRSYHGQICLVPDDSLFLPPLWLSGESMLSVEEMAVYPNPFNSKITLELWMNATEKADLYLTDVYGKQYAVPMQNTQLQKGKNVLNIDFPNLPKGVYFLRVKTEKQTYVRQIVKL